MRIGFLAIGPVIAGCLGLGMVAGGAQAAPLPSLTSADTGPSTTHTVDWQRRYLRRYGTLPPGPPPVVGNNVVIDADEDTVIIVPLRPASCGEFRYWNGTACVDARYNTPYLGPK
jgi:hypothetical protein